MSRLGKKTIVLPEKVDVSVADGVVTVKGPKGELSQEIFEGYQVFVDGSTVAVKPDSDEKLFWAKWGLLSVLINNMVIGVSQGYRKGLIIEGVGYRVALEGRKLTITAGYSHPVLYLAPEGITLEVEGLNKMFVSGIDKQRVGQVAAEIRSVRGPEPYKGKGIRYDDEVIIRKAGKTSKK